MPDPTPLAPLKPPPEKGLTAANRLQTIPHFTTIAEAMPPWATSLGRPTLNALKGTSPSLHPTLRTLTPAQGDTLRKTFAARWAARNDVEKDLARVVDVHGFAAPLLNNLIKRQYQLDLDVHNTFINLYIPNYLPVIGLRESGTTTWRVSLLDAALHNFELHETLPYAYLSGSGYISRPDAQGHFKQLNHITEHMPVQAFTALCRTLNLGARYKDHLTRHLGLDDHGRQLRLKNKILDSQRADLKADLTYAVMTRQIGLPLYESLDAFLIGLDNRWLTYRLTVLSLDIESPLIFMPVHQRSVVAYIPHDPLHPVKEYSSIGECMAHLTERLKSTSYQHFFSRFVAHDRLGAFLEGLKRTYWQVIPDTPIAPGATLPDALVAQTLIPIEKPAIEYLLVPIPDDLWETLYSRQLAKIFNDAKSLAVSTDAEDRKTREARLERLKGIGMALLNAAAFVIAPFVPVVGELMLLQMAWQLLDDTYEGIHDWVQGKTTEAFEHLFGVLESGIQAGFFAAGTKVLGGLLPKPSAFVQGMKPVTCNDGATRLWNPDISAYHHDLALPEHLASDELGLQYHQDKTLLTLSSGQQARHTLVLDKTESAGPYTLRHPTRPHAYGPRMQHNGEGAWLMEGERPQTWQGSILMRRLGPVAEGFSDAELEKLRIISGTDEGVLRRVHLHNEPTPPLLKDCMARLRIQKQNIEDITRIRQGRALSTKGNWLESLPTELPGWPPDKALNVFVDETLSGMAHVYGAPEALPEDSLRISQQDIKNGKLWPLIVDNFNTPQLDALLGPRATKTEAVNTLQAKVSDYARQRREDIFDHQYARERQTKNPAARLIESTFAHLPAPVTQALLETTSTLEKTTLLENGRIPLRVKNLATELEHQTRIAHAQEGLLEDDLLTPDGEKLAINTLKTYTDAIHDLHLEVRDLVVDGTLRCSHAPKDARHTRILVRKGPDAYETYDGEHALLHPASRFHGALMKALPERNSEHLKSRFAIGQNFKQWLADKYSAPGEIRTALDLPSPAACVATESETLLRGAASSRVNTTPAANPLQERVKALYPYRNSDEIALITARIDSEQALEHLRATEEEKDQLFETLDNWISAAIGVTTDNALPPNLHGLRRLIGSRIKNSWLSADKVHINKTGQAAIVAELDFSSTLFGHAGTDSLVLSRPLSHVGLLRLDDCSFSPNQGDFLTYFPNLKVLSLNANDLETLPETLDTLPHLRSLHLAHNRLTLNAGMQSQLKHLTRLQHLDLGHNPLGSPLAVGHMPELRTLVLENTRITQWPPGLFDQPRPKAFKLNLLGNEIHTVPDYPDQSAESWLIANARLERQKLDLESQDRVTQYRRALGLDPHRTYPPRGSEQSSFWLFGPPGSQVSMQELWETLEHEHGSQGFFEVIARMEIPPDVFETPSDQIAYQEGLGDLTQKVWRLIDAASNDTRMRELLFTMASSPTNCADAGAQIFNAMGLETMAHEFYNARSTPLELEKNLITLARGKARLAKIGDIARADVAQRVRPVSEGGQGLRFTSEVIDGAPGTVDEVEVHTGYQTRLSTSLELPWVPNYMVYRMTAQVGDTEFVRAYRLIHEGEAGDGLVNQILDVPFWETYLNKTYASELDANASLFEQKAEWLEQLRELQDNWVRSDTRLEQRHAGQRVELQELALKLAVPEPQVFTSEPMNDKLYYRIYSQIADERKELSRQLTRQALTKARLT